MYRKNSGFTLIELMITVALMAILLTIGVPSFQQVIRDNRLTTQANELVTALNTARSEAIKRGVPVTICKSNTQSSCTTGVQWEGGWMVFSDTTNMGTYDSGSEDLILVSSGIEGSNTLRTGGNFTNYVSYLANGESRGSSGFGNDTFRLCDDRGGSVARAIIISATGRIRVEKGGVTCP